MYFQNSIQIERLNSHFVQELKLFRHHQGPKLGCPNSMASEQHQESFRYILEILVILLWELYKYEESEHEQVEHTWYFTSVCSLLWTVLSLRLLEKTPPNLMFKFHADNCIISLYPLYILYTKLHLWTTPCPWRCLSLRNGCRTWSFSKGHERRRRFRQALQRIPGTWVV